MPCCGAIYSWFLSAGNVMLMHRYVWKIHQPTSAAWLALLDEDSYKEKSLVESNRYIFWCGAQDCAVGNGRRWESMVKMHMMDKKGRRTDDYEIAKQRSEATGYRVPFK